MRFHTKIFKASAADQAGPGRCGLKTLNVRIVWTYYGQQRYGADRLRK